MKYSQSKLGRVFVIRLENGDVIHEEMEQFAKKMSVRAAALVILGGADAESKLVVGPGDGQARPITPLEHVLDNVHEICGTGTLFPDEKGNPTLHMHIAAGRKTSTVTGCVRRGVKVWQVMEAVLFELTDTDAKRMFDEKLGFSLLEP